MTATIQEGSIKGGVATGAPQATVAGPTPKQRRGTLFLALLSVYVIWGSTYLAIRIALEGGFPPFLMGGVRFLIAGAIMYAFLRLRGTPNPTGKEWRSMAIVGALLLVGGNGGVMIAEQWVSSSLAAVWIASMPLWAALFAGLFGRWPRPLEWVGLAVGLVGVVLLNTEGNLQANPWGAVALTISTICWSFGSVVSGRLPLPNGLMSSAGEMLAGGAVLMGLSLVWGERVTGPLTGEGILAVLYLIVFGSIVAFSAYNYLLKRMRTALATSYAYVNPVVAVVLGVGFAGEKIETLGFVAMGIILAAVGLVALGRERRAKTKP